MMHDDGWLVLLPPHPSLSIVAIIDGLIMINKDKFLLSLVVLLPSTWLFVRWWFNNVCSS